MKEEIVKLSNSGSIVLSNNILETCGISCNDCVDITIDKNKSIIMKKV